MADDKMQKFADEVRKSFEKCRINNMLKIGIAEEDCRDSHGYKILKSLYKMTRLLEDTLSFDEEDKPIHECDYILNPHWGSCKFCEDYWEAKELLGEI